MLFANQEVRSLEKREKVVRKCELYQRLFAEVDYYVLFQTLNGH